MRTVLTALCAALLVSAAPLTASAQAPDSWEGLVKAPSQRMKAVYLLWKAAAARRRWPPP